MEPSKNQLTSTGCNTWIASTDIGSVVEESEAEEEVDEDEDEGHARRGGQEAEEEKEVGRDREGLTNLTKAEHTTT